LTLDQRKALAALENNNEQALAALELAVSSFHTITVLGSVTQTQHLLQALNIVSGHLRQNGALLTFFEVL